MKRELTKSKMVERSIITKFRQKLWAPFIRSIKKYNLIEENDKIAVCISGGKDSFLLAKLMQNLQSFSDVPFELEFIVMDPGYKEHIREKITANAKLLDIPIKIYNSNIFDVAEATDKNACYLCARMRRGCLYKYAKDLGCNKIALGHHMNDVIETTLIAMFYGSQLQAMLPILNSTNFEGMKLIRPLYSVLEEDITAWVKYNSLEFIACACKLTEKNKIDENASKRYEIKQLIKNLKQTNPMIEQNIFNSIHQVNLDTFVGYKKENKLYTNYTEKNKK
ncbi:MAG: tRNA 2-thiocytidine biosynthesis protein TtcA [Clostridiales bacterium]|nr:tRNA 2-thiocytidine biosynthesis protein TtcA [Clostridiales bacterium]